MVQTFLKPARHKGDLIMRLSLRTLLPLATAALLGGAAQAQVVRCTDTRTGAVTHTDGDCARGSKAREVQARQSPEEINHERAQAAQALEQKQQRLQAEAAQARLDAERDALRQREQAERAAAARPALPDYARSPECTRSRRNFDLAASSTSAFDGQDHRLQAAQRQMELDCLGPEGYANIEKNRPPPLPQPVVVYPPARWHQHPAHPRPPHLPAVQPQPSFPSFGPLPSFAPLPSLAPMPSQRNLAIDRRCPGRGCEDGAQRQPARRH